MSASASWPGSSLSKCSTGWPFAKNIMPQHVYDQEPGSFSSQLQLWLSCGPAHRQQQAYRYTPKRSGLSRRCVRRPARPAATRPHSSAPVPALSTLQPCWGVPPSTPPAAGSLAGCYAEAHACLA